MMMMMISTRFFKTITFSASFFVLQYFLGLGLSSQTAASLSKSYYYNCIWLFCTCKTCSISPHCRANNNIMKNILASTLLLLIASSWSQQVAARPELDTRQESDNESPVTAPVAAPSSVDEEYGGFEEYTSMDDDNTTWTEEEEDCDDADCPVFFEEPTDMNYNETNTTMVTIGSDGDATFTRNSNGTSANSTTSISEPGDATIGVSATSYSVITFPIDMAEFLLFDEDVVATMCLEREPVAGGQDRDDVRTYSVCMIRPELLVGDDIESLAKEEDFDGFIMPEDCVGGALVPLEITSSTEGICVDVSDVLATAATDIDTDVELSGFSRSLQSSEKLFFMIDASDPDSVGEGDRFYSSEDPDGRQPELTLSTGEAVPVPSAAPVADDQAPSAVPEEPSTDGPTPATGAEDDQTSEPTASNSTDSDVNIISGGAPTPEPTSGSQRILPSVAVLMISSIAWYVAMPM
jgi:hypothetical protein